MIDRLSAAQLLDFQGRIAPEIAAGQIDGAVALHNILEREGVAYLADEVGMGKTLVALGVLALYRHWAPDFRALIIAPRENIQRKWGREFRQFARNNITVRDLRVRALHDEPARAIVHCNSLLDLLHETVLDPDRDFISRMTSFSLPFGQVEAMKAKRDVLLELLPWIDHHLLDLRNKEDFKHNVARALCCGLPEFDLVIVDESHNLKHGFESGAMRNRVMGLALGRDREISSRDFRGYGIRAKRVLLLSATPVEDDYRQLWNQLDVFGKADGFDVLTNRDASSEDKRECARRILVRRITSLTAAGKPLTKNLYRREWRFGGVEQHDNQLTVPDHLSRLIVALVQKKVSETLRSPRFNNQFQIGMLASFESFMETASDVLPAETDSEASNFDQAGQSTDEMERQGADVDVLNKLARSYRRTFGGELPHPKMDAVVNGLAQSFETGEKALVFVRRVASVRELKRKLDERHDEHLLARLRAELPPEVVAQLDVLVHEYKDERRRFIEQRGDHSDGQHGGEDRGGKDTFFAWFFRGEGPSGVFSGATLQRRFTQASTSLSTFFEDNWVSWLLDVQPPEALDALARYLDLPTAGVVRKLEADIRTWLMEPGRPAERRWLYLGYQRAALRLLGSHAGPLQHAARVILDQRFRQPDALVQWTRNVPLAKDWIGTPTFFTQLRGHSRLGELLPIDEDRGHPSWLDSDFVDAFRRREIRREMVAAMCRLGYPIVDLFLLHVNRVGTLEPGARREGDDDTSLVDGFLERMDGQVAETDRLTSYSELRNGLEHSELLIDLNLPDARTAPLDELTVLFGRLLREQQPVGGMAGRINETMVRQFRMPGFPLVLVSTDLLQEGEDLHTFCSAVYHYGISWMPSSMEQRTGRIDRVNSATQRRLGGLSRDPEGSQLLQVYYPHLRDTVEVLQVDRVLRRMSDFIQMMHEDLVRDQREERRIDVTTEILRSRPAPLASGTALKTAFPVDDWMLQGESRPLAVGAEAAEALRARFTAFPGLLAEPDLEWHDTAEEGSLIGVLTLGSRLQPFTLLLRSCGGRQLVRCVSPIGTVDQESRSWLLEYGAGSPMARITSLETPAGDSYNMAVEGDVLIGAPSADAKRIRDLIDTVAGYADRIEAELWTDDGEVDSGTLGQLSTEVHRER